MTSPARRSPLHRGAAPFGHAALALLLALGCATTRGEEGVPAGAWSPADGPLATRWSVQVEPRSALPEYPRPTMRRDRWLSLNGLWEFEPLRPDSPRPFGRRLERDILVPFPVESSLSGIGEHHSRLCYRRTFDVPIEWAGERVLLHFGAVDHQARVWLNGREVGLHRGGYDPFTIDLTPHLFPPGPQELVVEVEDPTDSGSQPRGKQVLEPGGIWYSPVTGIWQTVWIEAVPERSIAGLRVEPDLRAGRLDVRVQGRGPAAGDAVVATALVNGEPVASARGALGETFALQIPNVRPWSPEDPFLYDLRVTRVAADGAATLDEVESYFGMRSIEVRPDDQGVPRIWLNGEPRFLNGVLDQGYWPDGLYTAPTDAALRADVELALRLGFDLVRKHAKVEPERWYAWCDQLGILVWQDMPSGDNGSPEALEQFERELRALVEARRNHPSLIGWVVFNEGWGQADTERLTALVEELDPTRLVTGASGWHDHGGGDVADAHVYPGPGYPEDAGGRAAVLGEYGGLGLAVDGHTWSSESWGYRSESNASSFLVGYEQLARELVPLKERGLCAAVYTQLTDVESECNGLVTYDRERTKADEVEISRINRGRLRDWRPLAPSARSGAAEWSYRFDAPGKGWRAPAAELGEGWRSGPAGFGTEGTPGSLVRTVWDTPQIWLRREFVLEQAPRGELVLDLHHDEDVRVWLNGELLFEEAGYTTAYRLVPVDARARALLRSGPGEAGRNVLAVHARQSAGGQYVDVGLVVLGTGGAP